MLLLSTYLETKENKDDFIRRRLGAAFLRDTLKSKHRTELLLNIAFSAYIRTECNR